MFGTVANLAGRIEHEQYVAHAPDSSAQDYVAGLSGFVGALVEWARHTGRPIRGIGIGVPGIVSIPDGLVRWAPSLQWRDLPLQAMLQTQMGLPVFVENDLNLAALGELGFGAGLGAHSLVSVAIGTGIGAGVVINGAIYRGAHETAGEIGYLPPDTGALGRHYAGFGALESLASGPGIVQRAQQRIQQAGLHVDTRNLTAQGVFARARAGEEWAQEVVAETVDYLSLALAAICLVLDPEVVVLGGGVAQSSDLLIGPILRRLDGVVPVLPSIVVSPLERRAAAMGAIMLVLNATSDAMVVNQLR
jgi:predicted NBD/HSP70 family sugar kinase